MKIQIKIQQNKYYRSILEILKPISPFSQMTSRDLDALSAIMERYYMYRVVPEAERNILVFSTDGRKEMYKSVNMSKEAFNNSLSKFRKLDVISGDRLSKKYLFGKDKNLNIEFLWKSN